MWNSAVVHSVCLGPCSLSLVDLLIERSLYLRGGRFMRFDV